MYGPAQQHRRQRRGAAATLTQLTKDPVAAAPGLLELAWRGRRTVLQLPYNYKMSTTSKLTLCASIITAAAIITGVHYKKKADQRDLRRGIYMDLERQERKKQNREELERQIELTRRLTEERDRREQRDGP